ncbi:orotidine-5'-phosphate decarboxylase [Malassezia equina]|uniref:Orotidine 5'-phosphate decarboxylase n=1 Tax=Malassezia equina TaxID=1381935 RepID=A0AAF0IYE2_9BASI|nr:orotidine-5'-phosphate decarboxylase [Malassezia equina]
MAASLTYEERAARHPNTCAKGLLDTVVRKQSNLCVSVDVTRKEDLLAVVHAVGPFVSLIKTHIDILEDFDWDLIEQLTELSVKHNFLIFEDRKFADIGNTVSLQYGAGVHKIARWSHITNAHLIPGPGIIDGLASVGLPLQRGLLLLAEMSTKGSLTTGAYTTANVKAAMEDQSDFVMGFIAMHRVHEDPNHIPEGMSGAQRQKDLLILTPGVGLDVKGDGKGQQYRTPKEVIQDSGCDIMIVGRGIYGALLKPDVDRDQAMSEVTAQAQRYRDAGWKAYLDRLAPRSTSPSKKIKMDLSDEEARKIKVPKQWERVLELLAHQRKEIITPVDTMGCEENGQEERRADRGRRRKDGEEESDDEKAKRLRFTTLVSLMLSSQTKDPVTANAVHQLQMTLDDGLNLASMQSASDDLIMECIGKVSFYRRKTEYLRKMTHMLQERWDGDVPRTVDELCEIPGVGPKMAFLQMQSMGLNVGIGVDTHVHRISNRLRWCKTATPEQTRLALQSWLPKQPSLCEIGRARLCPSYKKVDQKTLAKRVPVYYVDGTVDRGEGRVPVVKEDPAEASKLEW